MIHLKRLLASTLVIGGMVTAVAAVGTLVYAADKAPDAAVLAQAQAQVDKARELVRDNKLPEAKAANDLALKLAPDLQSAKILGAYIKRHMEEAANPTTSTGTTQTAAVNKSDKLTPEQMVRVKAYEITDADRTLAGSVDRKTLEDFWTKVVMADPVTARTVTADDREAFYSADFLRQARRIVDSRRNEYIDRLKITGDPVALTKFAEVNTWAVNNCAYQPGCHAVETSKESFRIYTRGGLAPVNMYTNFYLMTKEKAGDANMLDRVKPEESLLLQYALAAKEAKYTHPGVKKVPVRFVNARNDNYVRLTQDIDALNKFVPDYGLDFSLPAATEPK